jgi:hypothetical protein
MSSYCFYSYDQTHNNWLLFVDTLDSGPAVRPRYREFICKKCGKFDYDAVFTEGFEPQIRMRVRNKREIFETDDGFTCASARVLTLLRKHKVGGFRSKPIADTDWHVLWITRRVDFDASVYRAADGLCRICQRPGGHYGTIESELEIKAPKHGRVLFTPDFCRAQSGYDVFATEDVVTLLKHAAVRGGVFHRLLTADEYAAQKRVVDAGKKWKPEHGVVCL